MGNNKGKSKGKKGCEVCKIVRQDKARVGGPIIKLKGNWTLNHYGGRDTFLGWLALQPIEHLEVWGKFCDKQLQWLGQHIRSIARCLEKYWEEEKSKSAFANDRIERVYVVCFSEYFRNRDPKQSPHLHFHLIPRTEKTAKCLTSLKWTEKVQDRCDIIPWRVNKIWRHEELPEEYVVRLNRPDDNNNVQDLMKYLEENLPNQVESANDC